jgi:hypothetical protein
LIARPMGVRTASTITASAVTRRSARRTRVDRRGPAPQPAGRSGQPASG